MDFGEMILVSGEQEIPDHFKQVGACKNYR